MDSESADARITEIVKEADLCQLFIRDFKRFTSWTCYPEAGGFDILAVHQDGRQIGIQAKLKLNAKVAQQVLPHPRDDFDGRPGPDYRLVIVASLTEASTGISRMLGMLGVRVLVPRLAKLSMFGEEFTFGEMYELLEGIGKASSYGHPYLHDWNPEVRCAVPSVHQELPSGVPSPVQITPWKESAIRLVALMRMQGYIKAKQIADFGLGVSTWTQPIGKKQAWLKKGAVRGTWVETEHMPALDKQHPALYELALRELVAEQSNSRSGSP